MTGIEVTPEVLGPLVQPPRAAVNGHEDGGGLDMANASGPARSTQIMTLAATCLGLFLVQMDTTAVNLALPAVGRHLHGDLSSLQWVIDAYNVTFAALLLSGGALGDRHGRRRLFLSGVTVFVGGSLVSALAPALPILIIGRAVQGVGAALAIPQSLSLLASAFPVGPTRDRAMATWATAAGVALAAGPTVGGALVDLAGWQSIFFQNLPFGLAVLVIAVQGVKESPRSTRAGLDLTGQGLAAGFLALLTVATVDSGGSLTSATTLTSLTVAILLLGAFLLLEGKTARPMLPLRLLRRGQLPVAAVIAACMTFGMYGMLLLASVDLQQQRGANTLTAGLELLPLAGVFAVVSPLVGRLITRTGPRLPMTLGMWLMGGGLVALAIIGGDASFVELQVNFALLGFGLALNTGAVVGVAVNSVGQEQAGLASGVVNLARLFGATLGVAVLGAIVAANEGPSSGSGPGFLPGFSIAVGVGGAVEIAGALLSWYGIKVHEVPADRQ